MFKINHKDIRTMSGIFIVSFEDTSHFVLMLLLLALSKYILTGFILSSRHRSNQVHYVSCCQIFSMSSLSLNSIGNVFQESVSVLNWFPFQKHTSFVRGKDSIIVNYYGDAFNPNSFWELKAAAHPGFFRYWLLPLLNNVFPRTSYRCDT